MCTDISTPTLSTTLGWKEGARGALKEDMKIIRAWIELFLLTRRPHRKTQTRESTNAGRAPTSRRKMTTTAYTHRADQADGAPE